MNKLEALKQKLENQIEKTMDTIISIEELEQKEPGRELSNWHQIGASMIFISVLHRSLWETTFEPARFTMEQRVQYIEEVSQITHEHFLNLYGFDTKKLK